MSFQVHGGPLPVLHPGDGGGRRGLPGARERQAFPLQLRLPALLCLQVKWTAVSVDRRSDARNSYVVCTWRRERGIIYCRTFQLLSSLLLLSLVVILLLLLPLSYYTFPSVGGCAPVPAAYDMCDMRYDGVFSLFFSLPASVCASP